MLNQVPSCGGTSGSQYTPEPIDFWGVSSWFEVCRWIAYQMLSAVGKLFLNHSCSLYGFKNMIQLWSWPQSLVNSDLRAVLHYFDVKRLLSFQVERIKPVWHSYVCLCSKLVLKAEIVFLRGSGAETHQSLEKWRDDHGEKCINSWWLWQAPGCCPYHC